tara:strand:+ start:295 stop:465 length:171 start_codon:yes stop_codon:yes gene_type:complete
MKTYQWCFALLPLCFLPLSGCGGEKENKVIVQPEMTEAEYEAYSAERRAANETSRE